jgi:hypothetical protein
MNYKTIFMLAAMTVAAFVAIGSATPIFETAFAQDTFDQNVNSGCNGAASNARCQVGQNNQNGENDNEGTINFN